MVRERGKPERINRNSLGAMVGPGPLGDAIVLLCCFRGVACRPRPVGSDERDPGRATRGRQCFGDVLGMLRLYVGDIFRSAILLLNQSEGDTRKD